MGRAVRSPLPGERVGSAFAADLSFPCHCIKLSSWSRSRCCRDRGRGPLVASSADVLVVPNLEIENMVTREFSFVARADAATLAPGVRAPVTPTSRADIDPARLVSPPQRPPPQ